MDTSETYIKMCREAKEIQELKPTIDNWKLKDEGSLYYTSKKPYSFAVLHEDNHTGQSCIGEYNTDLNSIVWLPRQDQLQEMILDPGCERSVLKGFYNWIQYTYRENIRLDTFEQLWLGFIMKSKYQKQWNGETWIAA